MKGLETATSILTVIGAINWGLVGLIDFNLVTTLLADNATLVKAVYIIVGLSGVHQLIPVINKLKG